MNLSIDENWHSYHKIFLNNDRRNISINVSNYDIPKHCPYELLTKDVYIIGYILHTDYGDVEVPIYCKTHGKKHAQVIKEINTYSLKRTLYECGFPYLVVENIMKYV